MPGPGSRQQQAYDELFRRPNPAQQQQPQPPRPSQPQGQPLAQGYRPSASYAQQHPSHAPNHHHYHPQQQQYYHPGQYAPPPTPQQQQQHAYAHFGMTTPTAASSASTSLQGRTYDAQTPLARPQALYGGSQSSHRSSYFPDTPSSSSSHAGHAPYAPQQQQQQGSYSSQRSYSSAQAYQQGASWSGPPSAPPPAPSPAVPGYYPAPTDGEYGKLPEASYPPAAAAPASSSRSYTSPRPGYAASSSSGPPTASTSTSLFSRPSTSSNSSLPYTYPESTRSNGSYPASLASPKRSPAQPAHVPLPPTGAAVAVSGYGPPRLPEISGTHGDFFGGGGGFDVQDSPDLSWPRRQSGGGSQTPTVASAYSKRPSPSMHSEEHDGFDTSSSAVSLYGASREGPARGPLPGAADQSADPVLPCARADYNPAAYDRSRRSSADSDLRSLYQPQAVDSRAYLPLNQSTASIAYPYGQGTPFATSSPALQPRRSTESMRVMPTQPKAAPAHPADRALSFSAGERPDLYRGLDSSMLPTPGSAFSSSQPSLAMSVRPPSYSSMSGTVGPSPASGALVPRRSPVVYPALLSRVAAAFRERIATSERIKDGLVYQDAFDGRDAVDRISYIIKTSDRNLALLLGRALDAQKFFHDVTYAHRLRDSPNEIYQFKARLASPFLSSEDLVPGDQQQVAQHPHAPHSAAAQAQAAGLAAQAQAQAQARQPGGAPGAAAVAYDPRRASVATTGTGVGGVAGAGAGAGAGAAAAAEEDDSPLPSGVFTLLTDCYSPTCTRDRLCYSIACPRRLEQQARLNLKREGLSGGLEDVGKLKRSASLDSLVELRVRCLSLSLACRGSVLLTMCRGAAATSWLSED